MAQPWGTYSTYIGRVGALAVALGVGAAVSTGYGIGVARADDTTSNAGDGSSAPASSNPSQSTGGDSTAGQPSRTGSEGSSSGDAVDDAVSSDAQTHVDASGAPDTSVNDEGQSTDVDDAPDGTDTPDVDVVEPPASESNPAAADDDRADDERADDDRADDDQEHRNDDPRYESAPDTTLSRDSSRLGRIDDMDVDTGPDTVVAPLTARLSRQASDDAFAATSLVEAPLAAPQSLASLPGAVVSVATTFVGALLAPLLAPGPGAPAEPPLLWTLLGWVRREISRTFFNQSPNAVDDTADTDEDEPVKIPVLLNDADDDVKTIDSYTQGAHGTVVQNPDGTLTYTPAADYTGTDTFTYTLSDADSPWHIHGPLSIFTGQRHSDTATVTVTVGAVNDAPVADNDSYSVAEDGTLTVPAATGVLNGDTDSDSAVLTVTANTDPAHGTVSVGSDGSFTYTPDDDFNGTDTFDYTVTDGVLTDTATVTVTVTAVADAPIAQGDGYKTDEDTPLTINPPGVLGNDTDADDDDLTVTVNSQPENGTVTVNANGSFTYTPDDDFNGTDTFDYTVTDGGLTASATVTITVNAVNDPPAAPDLTVDVDEGTSVTGNLLDGATDPDGDNLELVGVVGQTGASGVIVPGTEPGSFTYTPNIDVPTGETRSVSFDYTVADPSGETATGTLTFVIRGVNHAPVADDEEPLTIARDTPVVIKATDLLAGDTDVDRDTLSVSSVTASNGTIEDLGDGTYRYTPPGDFTGSVTITYTVSDAHGGTDTGALAVTVDTQRVIDRVVLQGRFPSPPVVLDDGTIYQVFASATGVQSIAIIDPADPHNPRIIEPPSSISGTVAVDADGKIYYTTPTGTNTRARVVVLDPNDPENPTIVDILSGFSSETPVVSADGVIYQLLTNPTSNGVKYLVAVVDFADPGGPRVTELPAESDGNVVVGANGVAAIISESANGSGASVAHLTLIDRAIPHGLTTVDLPGFPLGQPAVSDEGIVYQAFRTAGGDVQVALIDPADAQNPSFVDVPDLPGLVGIGADGVPYYRGASGDESHLTVIDPTNPGDAITYDMPAGATGFPLITADGTIYQLTRQSGSYSVAVIKPTDPDNPVTVPLAGGTVVNNDAVTLGTDGTIYVTTASIVNGTVTVNAIGPADPDNPTTVTLTGQWGGSVIGPDGTLIVTTITTDEVGNRVLVVSTIGVGPAAAVAV